MAVLGSLFGAFPVWDSDGRSKVGFRYYVDLPVIVHGDISVRLGHELPMGLRTRSLAPHHESPTFLDT
jgi:hypothetical protein